MNVDTLQPPASLGQVSHLGWEFVSDVRRGELRCSAERLIVG